MYPNNGDVKALSASQRLNGGPGVTGYRHLDPPPRRVAILRVLVAVHAHDLRSLQAYFVFNDDNMLTRH